ncbi:Putative cyclin domain-containing protein [Septoria linicola]|uniref:Cyclin domain-containing protein n=1 Tax=Septoria linicola TaxID=215465 RepID=A0A9Q9AJ28_9PEZI|nr:putative cyclin domain-containing protein [Septoria linicola]USW48774.1 Putative cyclin domain-containing protein [Septoria linicola]
MAYQPQQCQQMSGPRAFPAFGYCDSYFVESHDDDDGLFARAAAERERARNVAKLRQKALGEELSRATADEYQEDVLDHMELMEGETMPDIHSIEIQTEIQWFMRPYLLDFLLEAHHAFQLLPETLHLAVNLLDRYCSRRVVYKRHYQLVGCAALLIAAKYGDRKERVPTIRELKSMCCSLYDDDMFTQMEWHVLQTLNWVIGHPTVTGFLQLALTEVAFDPELEHMSWYISELALYHKEFIPVRPSVMARSCLALARCILNRPQSRYDDWSARYDPQVVLNLSNHLAHPSQALLRKYASPHLSAVSTTIDLFLKHQAMLAQSQRAAQNQTPVHEAHMEIDSQPAVNSYLTPQTPQKAGYAAGPLGMLTPPITPDKDQMALSNYSANQGFVNLPAHCVPTPPSAGEQMHHNNYVMQQQQYMSQPQFVQ